MPALIYLTSRNAPLRVRQDAEDVVSLFEATPDRPVPLTAEAGESVFVNWRNVEYLAEDSDSD